MPRPAVPCPGPLSRRQFLKIGALALGGVGLGGLLPLRLQRRRDRPRAAGHLGHLHLAAGRAAAHGNVRHEAGRPGRVSRRLPADHDQRARHRRLRTCCRCTPRSPTSSRLIRSIAHNFADHGGGHKRFLTGRDPLHADRLRQRLPDGRLDGRQGAARTASAGVPNYIAGTDAGRERHRRLQLRLGLPRPVDAPVHRRRRSRATRSSRCQNLAPSPQIAGAAARAPRPARAASISRRAERDRSGTMAAMDDFTAAGPGPADERHGPQGVRPVAGAGQAARALRHARLGPARLLARRLVEPGPAS